MQGKKLAVSKEEARQALISGGVRDLGKFGYPGVRPENILTDPIYSAFFKRNLEDVLDQVDDKHAIHKVIQDLINEIKC